MYLMYLFTAMLKMTLKRICETPYLGGAGQIIDSEYKIQGTNHGIKQTLI